MLAGSVAIAQDVAQFSTDKLDRITPENHSGEEDPIFSTRPAKKKEADPVAAATVPTAEPSLEPLPGMVPPPSKLPAFSETKRPISLKSTAPAPAPAATKPNSFMPEKIPFGRVEKPLAPEVPVGPRTTVAIPVPNVDAVEVSEPAPPAPPPPGADPVSEDASLPTEFSSPIFEGTDNGMPRKIVIRALNKVTAQSQLFRIRPGETVSFGKLKITATICRVSVPTSQSDSAGLLDIREEQPGIVGMKALFHGWMYASSPSITSLEHPIYDVTMVNCDIASPAPKVDEKPAEKAPSKKKK